MRVSEHRTKRKPDHNNVFSQFRVRAGQGQRRRNSSSIFRADPKQRQVISGVSDSDLQCEELLRSRQIELYSAGITDYVEVGRD